MIPFSKGGRDMCSHGIIFGKIIKKNHKANKISFSYPLGAPVAPARQRLRFEYVGGGFFRPTVNHCTQPYMFQS